MPASLTVAQRRELGALRLAAQSITTQGLSGPGRGSPESTVRSLFAIQAQDFPGAKWAIGLRSGATDAAVESALASGSIVRSWPMRGTLHILPSEELRWLLALSRGRLTAASAKRHAELGIEPQHLAAAAVVAERVCGGGHHVRRDQLLAAFVEAGIPTTGQAGYHVLWWLAHEAITVFGPTDGKQPTFSLFDEWIPASRELTGDEAFAELARRYLTGHGPATDRDLAWWSNQTLTDVRRGIAAVASEFEARDVDGTRYWHAPGLEPARGAPAVHLLPGFDEYILGYQDRSAPMTAEISARILPGRNGVFRPSIVREALVVGAWRKAATARKVAIDAEWFGAASSIAKPAARYGRFLGTPVEIG